MPKCAICWVTTCSTCLMGRGCRADGRCNRSSPSNTFAHSAIMYRSRDLRGSALRCSARADGLAAQCGGASTPALRQASEPLPLTDREREIITLLGHGLSGRAVAERLTLSVRTVEGHIYRAMTKTGATSRDELAGLLRQE